MTNNSNLKHKAETMRRSGTSLNEITKRLKVPKSTIQYWCRDIILSAAQRKHLIAKQKMGGMMAAESLRKKRLEITKQLFSEGMRDIGKLSPREVFLIGIALYWAEGYRKGNDEFGFTNSDPKMIKFMLIWLRIACGVPSEHIHPRVCINSIYKNRISSIEKFWTGITRLPSKQFAKPTFIKIKNKKTYHNRAKYFGTLRIKLSKGTNFRRKLLGWIEGIASTA